MKNLTILLLPITLLVAISSSGQAALGLRFQQFSGINSTLLNPAMGALYHKKWDLNLVELGGAVSNNYLFIENTKIRAFNRFQSIDTIYSRPDLGSDQRLSPNSLVVDFYTREGNYYGEIRLNALGPSFLVRLGQHGIGFTTRFRTELETRFATDLGYYTYLNNRGSVNMTPSHINGMAWREWGLHYDYSIGSAEDRRLALGVNLRYLQGYEGFSISNEQFSYDKTGVDSFEVNPGAARLAFTTGNLKVDANTPYELKEQGKGWGIDLGAIYEYVGPAWNCNLGAAINDLGGIRFQNTAQLHQFRTQNIQTIRTSPYTTWNGASDLINKTAILSQWANGDPQASFVDSAFTVGLPTQLVLQVGFYKMKGLRFFGLYQHPLTLSQNQLQAPNNLALVSGWENNWFGAYLPLSFYRWQRMRVGAALRLAFLTLGTDNLRPWVSRGDLSEANFYMAVKISPWPENWFKGGGKARTGKKRGGKSSDCYTF